MSEKYFWSGNIAVAEGALRAGVTFYAGYPITPSSDLMEYMARELPKRGGVFIQGEDELSSINMVIGASIAGAKSMTATSGPGYSLMQEALGLAVMLEVPLVVVDVTRLGPSTGQATKSGQGDLMQARWGRHGDQYTVVYTASTPEEAYIMAIKSFNTSEKLRVPVTFIIDELTAHLWETVRVPDNIEVVDRRLTDAKTRYFDSDNPLEAPPMPMLGKGLNILYTSSTHDGFGYRKTQDPEVHRRLVERLKEKVIGNTSEVFEYEIIGDPDGGDVGIVAFGSVARVAKETKTILEREGIKTSVLNLLTLWPMDYELLRSFTENMNVVIVPEMNLGQLVYDIYQVRGRDSVYPYNKIGGGEPIYPRELAGFIKEVVGR